MNFDVLAILSITLAVLVVLAVLLVLRRLQVKSREAEPAGVVCKYPVLLHHGFWGGDFKLTHLGVRSALAADGHSIHCIEVSAANSIEFRANQLKKQVDIILEETGAARVNIIAHSKGGLDARYLISTLGYQFKVASLTTLGTPHRGTPLADFALEKSNLPLGRRLVGAVVSGVGVMLSRSTISTETDGLAAVKNLTEEFMNSDFNKQNLDSKKVYYQSWSAFIEPGTTGYMQFAFTWKIVHDRSGKNDGVVPVSSAKWGRHRGTVSCNHLDLIGTPLTWLSEFDHIFFYRKMVFDLSKRGY